MSSDEQIRHLAAQVENLSAQVAHLQQRLAELERTPPRSVLPATPIAPPPLPLRASSTTPETTGLKLLNRAGALTLFIGIIFFFKYAIDNQWIAAAGRVMLGIIAGVALFAAGEWIRKRGQTVFAQGLSACGIATLYISIYAASGYYKLIPPALAFVAFLVVAGGAIALSLRSSDAVLAVVGYFGAIAAPGLFSLFDPVVWAWLSFVYLFLIQVSVLRQAGDQFKHFFVPLMAAAIVGQAFWIINPRHPIICVTFFCALAALHFRPPRLGSTAVTSAEAYVVGHVLVLLAGLRFLAFWFEKVASPETRSSLLSEMLSVFLGVYGVALLASAVLRKSATDRVIGLTLLGLMIGKLYAFDVWLLTRFYRITAFVALGILLLLGSFVYSRWKQHASGA